MASPADAPLRVAVVGGGWSGLTSAIRAAALGHRVTVFESARVPGGRARPLAVDLPNGQRVVLDNGQHILAGAYGETLRLMRSLGLDPAHLLLRAPLALRYPDGSGLTLPDWPAPLDALWGIARARGWRLSERIALLRAAARWRRDGFECDESLTVADLCRALPARVAKTFIDPLCVSALNTPMDRASACVFLRVMRDALFARGEAGMAGSNLLLPRTDLGGLLPDAALRHLRDTGHAVHTGHAVRSLCPRHPGWQVDGEAFDRVILACAPWESARLVSGWAGGADRDGACNPGADTAAARRWVSQASALQHEPIATVYALAPTGLALPFPRGLPMLALPAPGPAQFVFNREALGGPAGLLAFVASACHMDRHAVECAVLSQAAALGWAGLTPVQTVVEKRATFACTPGLSRPAATIAPGLLAAGDHVEGPYPATLEGAVRSGLAAAAALGASGLN